MIVLKILLWIFLVILGLIVLICAVPADVDFGYVDGKLSYKIKLWFFDLMDSSHNGFLDKRKKKKKAKRKKDKHEKPEDDALDISDIPDIAEDELPDESIGNDTEPDTAQAAEAVQAEAEAAPEEGKKKKKKKDKKKKEEEVVYDEDGEVDDEDEDDGKDKKSLSDKLEMIGGIWLAAKNPAHMIFKGFKFRNFYIDFIIADEDAYKCALKYGRYSTLIYNGLAQMGRLFTLRFRTVDIQPGFGLDKGRWDTSFSVSFRLGTAVIAGLWFLVTYIFRVFIPGKRRKRKAKKAAAVQNQ